MQKIASKLVLVMLCALTTVWSINKTKAQTPQYTGGVWMYSKVSTNNFYNDFVNQPVVGEHLTDSWALEQPMKTGAYNWVKLDSALYQAARRGHWIGLQQFSGQDCPAWVMAEVGSYSTIDGNDDGPYPYYFHPKYKEYLFKWLKDYVVHIALLPSWVKDKIVYRQNSEGSTGDQGPHKGNPVDYNYNGQTDILATDWTAFRRAFWDTLAKYHAAYLPGVKMMFNCGNDGEDFDYVAWKYPGHYNKEGNLSHEYGFSGEVTYFDRDINFFKRNVVSYSNKLSSLSVAFNPAILPSRGEMQGPALDPTHAHKENFFRFMYARTGGLTFFNITQGYVNQAKETFEDEASSFPIIMFNKYSGKGETNRGYSLPRDAPSWNDTVRFPVGTYGSVIATGSLPAYNNAINNINSKPDSLTFKEWKRMLALNTYINTARKTAILAAVPGAQNGSTEWTRDFGTDMVQNLEMNVKQLDVLSTSKGEWRVGPDTSFYGRFARSPKLVNNKQVWKYDVSEAIMKTRGSDTVQISVTYLDAGNNSFQVTCERCKKTVLTTVTKTNTGNWKNVTADAANFRFKPNAPDFNIEFTGSTIVGMVEVWNKSKQ